MSTRPSLALWAGLRRTRTVVQLSRGRSPADLRARHHRRLGARCPAATCAKKRTRSPSGRASILVVGLGLSLSACTNPYDPVQRTIGGGLIGAGSGAAIGAAAGGGHGAALGAAVGGAVGAVGGLITTPAPPRYRY